MTRTLIVLLTAVMCTASAAARNAADFFVQAPPSAVPMLAKNTRLDMLDYFNSGMATPSANSLGGRSRVLALGDTAITVEMSRDSRLQLVVIPQKADTTIAVIETVLTPVPDSSVRLFRPSDWSELPTPAMPTAAFFTLPSAKKQATEAEMPPFLFLEVVYEPGSDIFRFVNQTAQYYAAADTPSGLKLLAPEMAMRLKNGKFVPAK